MPRASSPMSAKGAAGGERSPLMASKVGTTCAPRPSPSSQQVLDHELRHLGGAVAMDGVAGALHDDVASGGGGGPAGGGGRGGGGAGARPGAGAGGGWPPPTPRRGRRRTGEGRGG